MSTEPTADTTTRPRVVTDPTVPPGSPGHLRIDRGEREHPKPLGATEVARAFLAKVAHSGSEHSSVELARNAKGDTQIKVTVRSGEGEAVATIEDAAAKAREIYDALAMLYPMSGPAGS